MTSVDATTLPLPRLDALHLGAHRLSGLTDAALADACGVHLGFFGREGGVSTGDFATLNCGDAVGDDPVRVARNRRRVLAALGDADAPVVVPRQVHGAELVVVAEGQPWQSTVEQAAAGADGVVVDRAEVAALLNFADCLPLIMVAPTGAFAVVHCGWRGTVAHLARIAAHRLAKGASCDPAAVNAYIGPHIRSECFEVGPEVAQQFFKEFGSGVLADEGRHVDLAAAVTADLSAAGLDERRIADAKVCTQCHRDEYFSYRATGGCCGRHCAAAIFLDHERERR